VDTTFAPTSEPTETPPDYCADGAVNYDESDVDCGGGYCPRCEEGKLTAPSAIDLDLYIY
jgi:hypothetical protein